MEPIVQVQQYVKITGVQIHPTGGHISYFCTFWKMPQQSMTQFYSGSSTGDKLAMQSLRGRGHQR